LTNPVLLLNAASSPLVSNLIANFARVRASCSPKNRSGYFRLHFFALSSSNVDYDAVLPWSALPIVGIRFVRRIFLSLLIADDAPLHQQAPIFTVSKQAPTVLKSGTDRLLRLSFSRFYRRVQAAKVLSQMPTPADFVHFLVGQQDIISPTFSPSPAPRTRPPFVRSNVKRFHFFRPAALARQPWLFEGKTRGVLSFSTPKLFRF